MYYSHDSVSLVVNGRLSDWKTVGRPQREASSDDVVLESSLHSAHGLAESHLLELRLLARRKVPYAADHDGCFIGGAIQQIRFPALLQLPPKVGPPKLQSPRLMPLHVGREKANSD